MLETISQWVEAFLANGIWARILLALVIFLIFALVRGIFTRYFFKIILRFTRKTRTDFDTNLALAFERPMRSLILVTGLYLALTYLSPDAQLQTFMLTVFRSYIIAALVWGLYNLAGSDYVRNLGERFSLDQVLVVFLANVFKFVLIALSASIIAQEFGYDVNGFVAGLGLGGLAFALAAKDAAANIFGGIVIIVDKPFSVGDWIYTPSVEGTVEEVRFRSTKVRTFAKALVTVPNAAIANEPITNWTRMGKRRVTFHLGVTYTTPRKKLQRCVERIEEMLKIHPEVDKEMIFVFFDQFNSSSLDIFIYFFTVTTVWGEYLQVKEDINFKIMEILEQEGVSVAFPSRSIYFENTLQGNGLPEKGTHSPPGPAKQ